MPAKYHIIVEPVADRFTRPGRFMAIEKDGCLGCLECVKRQCIYDVFGQREYCPDQLRDSADSLCRSCLWCVQQCKRRLFSRQVNPEFELMGDDYWKPRIIQALWDQAYDGKVPVSGAGYTGPFCGPGFDQIWTDMSEIVRPTRDGIHGREYINTSMDIGRRPRQLAFDSQGKLTSPSYPLISTSLPIVINQLPFGADGQGLRDAMALAARKLDILVIRSADELIEHGWPTDTLANLLPHIASDQNLDKYSELLSAVRAVHIDDTHQAFQRIELIKKAANRSDGQPIVIVRVDLTPDIAQRVVALAEAGAEAVHLCADYQGNELTPRKRFVTEAVTEVHEALIQAGLRDTVTLIASGGIGLAEHVAKIIICGANLAAVDIPFLIANECRVCLNCRRSQPCPVKIDEVPADWSCQRMVNLMGSWHAQIIEVMGAMGLREARRLRGEAGRAMFFQDLERESFAPVFGRRLDAQETKTA